MHKARAVFSKGAGASFRAAELARVVEELREMARATEADFLAVGEKLMSFLTAARDIRADISQLADHISGDSGERACSALAGVLHRSMEMKERVEGASRTLDGLPQTAARIQKGFAGFREIVLGFQVAATLGRIETARLDGSQSGLGHLADEVGSCTQTIRARVDHALEAAAQLDRFIDAAIRHVAERDLEQLQALPSLVSAVQEALAAFRQRQQQATRTSAKLERDFAAFSEAIHGLVEALQFHDITRQQVEHVVDALEGILRERQAHRSTAPPSPHEAAVMELQRQQLAGAAKAFAASVQRIQDELKQVALRGSEMEAESKTLLGLMAEDQQSSFFDEMERCFSGLLAAAGSCAAADGEAARTTAELQRHICGFESCIDEVRTIWLQVHRLALNATIEAIHLGPAGEPLSVVAGSMQTLYVNAEQRSCDTEDSLAALSRAVSSMAPVRNPAAPASSGAVTATDELRTRIDELHGSSERSLVCSKRIREVAATLISDVRLTADRFTVGERVAEVLDRSCATLRQFTASADIDPASVRGGLESLAAQYTMRAEREVHERATAAAALAPLNEPGCQPAPAMPDDLGEGVELF